MPSGESQDPSIARLTGLVAEDRAEFMGSETDTDSQNGAQKMATTRNGYPLLIKVLLCTRWTEALALALTANAHAGIMLPTFSMRRQVPRLSGTISAVQGARH